MILTIILVLILIVSLATDLKYRKIFNCVTLPTIIFAFLFYLLNGGLKGFLFSGEGFVVGLVLLIIPYLLGGMGAGDVKLMAAIGALMGSNFVFYSFIYTALIGGVIAFFLIIKARGLMNLVKSFFLNVVFFRSNLGSIIIPNDKNSSISFPYGIAIVLGTFCTLIWGGF